MGHPQSRRKRHTLESECQGSSLHCRAQCTSGPRMPKILVQGALPRCTPIGRASASVTFLGRALDAAPQFCGFLEWEWDYWWMRLASWVGTKKEISRKHIIQVGFTQLCGLGRFPEYPARCKASGRHDARMCLMASRVVRERTRRTPQRLSLTPINQCVTSLPSLPPAWPQAIGHLPIFLMDTFFLCQ